MSMDCYVGWYDIYDWFGFEQLSAISTSPFYHLRRNNRYSLCNGILAIKSKYLLKLFFASIWTLFKLHFMDCGNFGQFP